MSIDGLTLYCANFVVPSISVISTVSQTVTHTVSLSGGSLVLDLQITPDDSILYAVDGFAAVAWKITNPSTAPVATSFATGSSAQHLAPTTDSSQIWFTEFAGSANQVENYTVPADTLIHTIAFGGSAPGPIVITPRSGFHPTPPVTLVIPSLFIPRKGLPKYEGNDYMIDFLTIERWAQGIH
jgi:DNA-binding beta-propeller fold protein YncE